MKENIFKNPYDAVLLTYNVLKRLNSGNVNTFEQRLRSQKIQYFAQLFGASPFYIFNLYLRGPYSPILAHDLFQINSKDIQIRTSKFIREELERRFLVLKKFINGKTNRQLEIIATLHWLIKKARFSNSEACKKLKELKMASLTEIKYAFNAIKNL